MSESPTPQEPSAEPPQAPQPPVAPQKSSDERMWAMLCHLSALLPIPSGNIIGPLVVWLIKKNEMPLVDENGKKALNFQITMMIAAAVAFVTVFVLVGFFLLPAVGIFSLVCTIIAAVKTNNGEQWDYPLSIKFLK